jgi:hypothetical protein
MNVATRRLATGVVLCAACAPAQSAGAAGPPLPSYATGKAGVVAPGGDERLITRRAPGEQTLVVAVRRGDRKVLRSGRIDGHWRVAPATFDGANTGLSADGRVLVLPRPEQAIPPPETRLAVVDAGELTVRRTIALPGFFTLDAISPDGRWAYLIQYAGQDVLDYRVRALDTTTGKLAAHDVVDPREPDEQMGGLPFTRKMSRDGRWAYTLYSGGEESFIHALDTVGRTAACIDLEMLPPVDDVSLVEMSLSRDGSRLRVRNAGDLVATVNTRTFAVREPGERAEVASEPDEKAAAPPRRASAQPADDDGGFPWLWLLPAAGLGGLVLVIRRPRGRSPA